MKTIIDDYHEFSLQLRKYGFSLPNGLAFIPLNFGSTENKDELIYYSSTKTIKKLWKLNELRTDSIEMDGEKQQYLHQHSAEWIAPTIFLGASLLSDNPNTISVALSVVANYVTDLFKGKPSNSTFKMELIIEEEKDKTYKKITFEGEPKDVNGVIRIIRELKK